MRKISAVLVILIGICYSCEKKEDPKYSGEIILSSELLQSGQSYSYYGFTFEDGMITMYPPNSSVQPDLAAIYNNFNQDVTLQSSNQIDAFYKNGDFQSASEAEAFFYGYAEVTANNFQSQGDNIKINQVWTVQTASDKFAKIWIKNIQIKTGSLSDYVELTIKYQYQPDGTKTFPG
jgi:hypothetical protein